MFKQFELTLKKMLEIFVNLIILLKHLLSTYWSDHFLQCILSLLHTSKNQYCSWQI